MSDTFTPHAYQEKAIQFLVENAEAGLFLSPGLGKTSITLAAFKVLREVGFVDKMLVIAPLRPCYTVWPKEVKKWKDFSKFSVGVLHGAKKDKILREDHDIYVVNPEGLRWLFSEISKVFGRFPFQHLVVDESSRFKHCNTQRFKTLKPHLPKFKRRTILTGSPAANSLLDIFGQMYVMDIGKTFGPYITHFRNEFFFQTGYGGYEWRLKPKAETAIHQRIAPRVLRMSDKDYLKMPKLIFRDIEIELPPKARAIYDQMENALRLDFEEGRVVASNSAVATMKCRQIANGGIYLDPNGMESRGWQQIHEAKSEALEDLIEELEGQPALIAYDFLHDLERIRKVTGKTTPHIGGGGVKPKDFPKLIEQWAQGDIPALIGNPQSMAHGVDGLQAAGDAIIWYSLTWNYEEYDQFIRRLYRQGRKKPLFVWRIIAKDTVDEAIVKALETKEGGQNVLFKALRDYWK